MIQLENEKLAALVAQYLWRSRRWPSKFPEMAADRIEEGVNKHNLRGAAIGGHANGDELSNPKFDACWKKGGGAGCLVFMHTQGIEEMNQRLAGQRRA